MQLPLTLRLAYHSFRALIRAALIFFIAWIVFIPASSGEKDALGVPQSTQFPPGLRTMRLAQVVVAIAPPELYAFVARMSGTDVPPFMIEIAMAQLAAGTVIPPPAKVVPRQESDRGNEGPR